MFSAQEYDNHQRALLYSGLLTDDTFRCLKYLAIDVEIWCLDIYHSPDVLMNFKSLVELTIVHHDIPILHPGHESFRMQPYLFKLVDANTTHLRRMESGGHEICEGLQ